MIAYQKITSEEVQWVVELLARGIAHVPMVKTLLILIVIDMACGLLVAFTRRALSSTISFRGVTRKVTMLLMVAMGAVLEPLAQGLPVAQLVAMFYIVTEGLSCLENAAALGVPLPRVLRETLVKLREGQKARVESKIPGGTDLAQNTQAIQESASAIRENTIARKETVTAVQPVAIVNTPEHPVPVISADHEPSNE